MCLQVLDLPSGKLFKSIQAAHSNIASSVCFRAHRPWELITAGFDQTVARCANIVDGIENHHFVLTSHNSVGGCF
eukprot:1148091-Pelagomonas_calceolata.AAC.8